MAPPNPLPWSPGTARPALLRPRAPQRRPGDERLIGWCGGVPSPASPRAATPAWNRGAHTALAHREPPLARRTTLPVLTGGAPIPRRPPKRQSCSSCASLCSRARARRCWKGRTIEPRRFLRERARLHPRRPRRTSRSSSSRSNTRRFCRTTWGARAASDDIDNDDPEEIRFAQVVTVTREPSVEMTQASSPVARRAAPPATARGARRRPPPPPPPRRRRRRRAAAPPRVPAPALLLTPLAARRAGQTRTKSRASGTTIPGYPDGPDVPFVTKSMGDDGADLTFRGNSTTPRAALPGIRATCARTHPQTPPSCDDKTLTVQRSMVEYPCALAGSPPERRPSPRACSRSTALTRSSRLPPPPPSSPAVPLPTGTIRRSLSAPSRLIW